MSTHEVSWTSSAYPKYESYEQRLKTFFDRFWPISFLQKENMMAKAGFFYTGFGDIVTCAFCGICLHKWLPKDKPMIEHKKFNENCKFVRLFQNTKDQIINQHLNFFVIIKILYNNFISSLQSICLQFRNAINYYFHKYSDKKMITKFNNICKICFNEDSDILLLPCHHISTCISCSLCTNFCPICRCKIERVIKVYFA